MTPDGAIATASVRLAAAGVERPRAEARRLWEAAAGVAERFEQLAARRAAREPFAYIAGHKEFWSLDFKVGPGVLIPRPDTESLVERALALFPDRAAPLAIADLGSGSGALLVALLKEFPRATGAGFESAPQAMAFARANVEAHGVSDRARLILADWSEAPSGAFDLVVSNPPYIASADIAGLEPEVRNFEPLAALDGGPDGLDAYRALAGLLPRILKPGGFALLEIGAGQDVAMEPMFQGLEFQGATPDLAGIPRALTLKRPK